MTIARVFLPAILALGASTASGLAADWKPAQGPLATRWAKDVSPDKALPEYPRPQMVRKEWRNLNGLWEYAVRPKGDDRPEKFNGQILVPYPIESALSGVMKRIENVAERLWYRRTFAVPKDWSGKNVLLHFGAVNWESTVWVNGKKLGEHRGGYDGFDYDITDALKPDGEQEIVVSASNPADAGTQPRGKQVRKSGGIFYTPSTGIWQTVWIEPVPKTAIDSVTVVPDVDKKVVKVAVKAHGELKGKRISLAYWMDQSTDSGTGGGQNAPTSGEVTILDVAIDNPRFWTPESPFLYQLHVKLLGDDASAVDSATTYFGMRKISIAKDDKGVTRIFLNNKPQYMIGPLDQGFWPDGIYTAPTDDALKYDIEMTKKLGYNMARKHVKVEPDRWYYWADKLGLLVWQDMPSGDRSIGSKQPDLVRTPESAKQYDLELKQMIDGRRNHPSIIMWVVFNEGWGQFDTPRVTNWVKEYDPSRLVNCASGWTDRGVGDVHDIHVYPGPGATKPEEHRAAVLGEFGGLGLPLEGHTWQSTKNWGYRKYNNRDELTKAYLSLMDHLQPQIADPGMSAAVYTQTTDVETEVNGLMTYDREIVKPDEEQIAAAHRKLFEAANADAKP
jgi:beta-galactosidase/beta-glucuronidase